MLLFHHDQVLKHLHSLLNITILDCLCIVVGIFEDRCEAILFLALIIINQAPLIRSTKRTE